MGWIITLTYFVIGIAMFTWTYLNDLYDEEFEAVLASVAFFLFWPALLPWFIAKWLRMRKERKEKARTP